jgi:hypothetical protein
VKCDNWGLSLQTVDTPKFWLKSDNNCRMALTFTLLSLQGLLNWESLRVESPTGESSRGELNPTAQSSGESSDDAITQPKGRQRFRPSIGK